jgi:predicted nuclease with RNAse H fold
MPPIYLGIDVAGAKNTWMAGLSAGENGLLVPFEPRAVSLERVVEVCEETPVVAAAIDAQLTMSLSAETGFRASDRHLRELLPADCRSWVASINSLMAVPVRGRLLAEYLSPLVGTLLETHPRASLLFGLGEAAGDAVRTYKRGGACDAEAVATLWEGWAARFDVRLDAPPRTDGALDALVCATVATLYHHAPDALLRLRERAAGDPGPTALRGRGPFYVVAPRAEG